MPITVVKLGASVLNSKQNFENLIQVVNNYKKPIVIVVSAFKGVTKYLSDSLKEAIADDQVAQKVTDQLYKLKKELFDSVIKDDSLRKATLESLKVVLSELYQYFRGISLTGDASAALQDHVLSYGEKLSAIALKGILSDSGISSEVIYPESLGLVTDGEYGSASVDFGKSFSNVTKALSGEKICIVPGSYGVSSQGKITLFGQNGSDYMAASLAKCISAGSVDIWKSTDGFSSADPQLVRNPLQIKMLTYNEAAELAYFGAKILHPRTVEPLTDSHIPIRIFNINKSQDVDKPFSVVNSEKIVTNDIIKSVTFSDDFGILKLEGPGVGINPGILAKVTTALYRSGINIISVLTSQISINILLAKPDLQKAYSLANVIELSAVADVKVVENISVVVAIGNGLSEQYGVAARIYTALAKEKINVLMSCSGASPIVSYFLVRDTERTKAVKAIHREIFETNKN